MGTVPTTPACLHRNPPLSPTTFFARRRRLLALIAVGFGFFAVSAATANAWLLLRWDRPIQRFVEGNRNDLLDASFLLASRFGSTMVVLSLGVLVSVLTWSRCRAVTVAVVAATLGRPLIEFTLKVLVGRERPDFERMVAGNGPSFPSGHVMASIALWGLLPMVVALFTRRRALWWVSVVVSVGMIVVISASRVYLGVHWASDVFAGLLLGVFFLIGVEWVLHRAHHDHGCRVPLPVREPVSPAP